MRYWWPFYDLSYSLNVSFFEKKNEMRDLPNIYVYKLYDKI
jgi:hypothetical protein